MKLGRAILNMLKPKSFADFGTAYVRTSDRVKTSPYDYTAMKLLSIARGPVDAYATLNASACAALVPRLFRKKSAKGVRLNARRIDNATAAYLKGHTQDTPNAKAMAMAGEDDMVEVVDGEVLKFLRKPSPLQTGYEFRFQCFYYMQICGDFGSHIADDGPDGLAAVPLPPQYVTIEVGADGIAKSVLFGREQTVRLSPDECVFWKLRPGRANIWRGEGFLASCVDEAELHNIATVASKYAWDNNQRPDYLVALESATTADQLNAVKAQVEAEHMGLKNTGKPLLVRGKATAIPLNFSPKDAMIGDQLDKSRAAIRAAFGVPESFDKLNDANLASSQTGLIQHRRNTVLPLVNLWAEQTSESVLPKLGLDPDSYVVAYTSVIPDGATEQEKTARMSAMVTANSFLRNEVREQIGLEGLPGPEGEEMPTPGATPAPVAIDGTNLPKSIKHKAASPLTDAGIERFAAKMERVIAQAATELVVRPDGTVDLGDFTRRAAAVLLDNTEAAFMAALSRASGDVGAGDGVPSPADAFAALDAYTVQLAGGISERLAADLTQAVRDGINSGIGVADVAARVKESLKDSSASRAMTIARTETATVAGQGDLFAWKAAGVTKKRWILAPGSCEICNQFYLEHASKDVPIDHAWLPSGSVITAGSKSFTTYRAIDAHPLHPNCRCSMEPI